MVTTWGSTKNRILMWFGTHSVYRWPRLQRCRLFGI